MKLRPQPRPRRATRHSRGGRAPVRPLARRSRGASRPGVSLLRRIGARLPSLGRSLALLATIASAAALVALFEGPWLRVTEVAFAGNEHTDAEVVNEILDAQLGTSLLAVQGREVAAALEDLPAVARAEVTAVTSGRLEARLIEHEPAFVWQTRSRRFLGAADGTIFASFGHGETLPAGLEEVPLVRDERWAGRLIRVGDVLPEPMVATALMVVAVDPAALGSSSADLSLRLDDVFGFRLVSGDRQWEIALGTYGSDGSRSATEAAAQLDRQVAAVRTLFAQRPEADIGWVDVRNPGKVYFRAKG